MEVLGHDMLGNLWPLRCPRYGCEPGPVGCQGLIAKMIGWFPVLRDLA